MRLDQSGRTVEILLAEDSAGDVRLTREALKRGKVRTNLNVAHDGEEAMDYLARKGKYAAARRPDLVLLDLNMPKKDGFQVLHEIRSTPDLQTLPVIVLTTSSAERDIERCYRLNANCYITKPDNLDEFTEALQGVENFWTRIAQVPENA